MPSTMPRVTEARSFAESPFMIYWETTRSCGLACKHCRAEAIKERDPGELTTAEGRLLLEEISRFAGNPPPHLVMTGGDPLRRDDIFSLIEYGTKLGIHVSAAPAVTDRMTQESVAHLKSSGVNMVSLSVDGASPQTHDGFRGVRGCFDQTRRAVGWMQAAGIPVQINTLVTEDTRAELPSMYEQLKSWGVDRWSLFFLITVGRGRELRQISPEVCEELMDWAYRLGRTSPFPVKTTEAPHFRRLVFQRLHDVGMAPQEIHRSPVGCSFGFRDGNGILFISHTGDVTPSGFLPLSAGNVREQSVVDIYRDAQLFQQLRDPDQFLGKCGRCEFRSICGGSRARAYAMTGNHLASDPLCRYVPGSHSLRST